MNQKVKITGVGRYLPATILNDELTSVWGNVVNATCKLMDIKKRTLNIDLKAGKLLGSNSDLAVNAARDALDCAKIQVDKIELIILATSTPDFSVPPTVTFVQDKLGLKNCAAMEINSGGIGFIQGMLIAQQFLQTNKYSTALVIGSELNSRSFLPFLTEPEKIKGLRVGDLITFICAGDGAGAIVLQTDKNDESIIDICIGSTETGEKPGLTYASVWDGLFSEIPSIENRYEKYVTFNFELTMRLSPKMGSKAVNSILSSTGLKTGDIDTFIIPVGNQKIIEKVGKEFDVPQDNILTIVPEVGQMGNALLPITLAELYHRKKIKAEQKIVLQAGDVSNWNYAAALIKWPYL